MWRIGTTACTSLVPIACNDDSPGCGAYGKFSDVCLTDLVPGRTYYILLGSRTYDGGQYRLRLSASCAPADPLPEACLDGQGE